VSDFLLLIGLLAIGLIFLVEGLLARYELMMYAIRGRFASAATLPPEVPYARGADPGRPPDAYVVYLDGIGKRRFSDTPDSSQLVAAVIAAAPELRMLGRVQPYSPSRSWSAGCGIGSGGTLASRCSCIMPCRPL
jgi:hypothetical protein